MGDTTPKVVIFGAGITGLTVAHELVERGWDVTVVEKEIDPLNIDECAIGGLAKTQWSVYQARFAANRPTSAEGVEPPGTAPTEARPLVPTARLRRRQVGQVDEPMASWSDTLSLEDACAQLNITKDALPDKLRCILDAILDDGSKLYLARVADRMEAIAPFAPWLTISRPELDDCARDVFGRVLRVYLLCLGAPEVLIIQDETVPRGVWRIDVDLRDWSSSPQELPNNPGDFSGILPGEHGFRFFPALYRHLFDTLRRIPVRGDGQNFGDTYRTVYDNLVPTESNWLAVDDCIKRPRSKKARERGVVRFPRRLRKSLREVLDAMSDMQTELGYTARDIELLKLRLYKYMTSCRRRRNEQYEGMSWSDFMGLSDLSPIARRDMERAPQLLAAMTAKQSDARTQGNLATQLMLDPLNADERVDSTLNGPTTVAWLIPWKDYLVTQGVRFVPGALTGFEPKGEGKIRPCMADLKLFGGRSPRVEEIEKADYYVLALPIQAWSDNCRALVTSWMQARMDAKMEADHVGRLGNWLLKYVRPGCRKSLYKGLSGIQFYFDSDELARTGHTLFMDSPWRICAISQASFWSRRRESFDTYRGIVSIDIGSLADGGLIAPREDQVSNCVKPFMETVREKVHGDVWAQVHTEYSAFADRKGQPAPYRMYRIDEYIRYDSETSLPCKNLAPFLINGVHEWDHRAGWDTARKGLEPCSGPVEEASAARYQLMPRLPKPQREEARKKGRPSGPYPRWVLAGTFMQTWTRATTMESANESARHAVNTLLEEEHKKSGRSAQPCRIWNPEDYEHPDLRIWQELDDRLYCWDSCEPLPHMIDILELDTVPDMLLERGDLSSTIERLVACVARKGT